MTREMIIVERDDLFWKTKMEPILSRFYDNCLLPEILDSTYCRNMPIRDPEYILDAAKKRKTLDQERLDNDLILNNKKCDITEIVQDIERVKQNNEKGCNAEMCKQMQEK